LAALNAFRLYGVAPEFDRAGLSNPAGVLRRSGRPPPEGARFLTYHERGRFTRMDSRRDLQRKWDRASRYDLATVALEAVVFRRLRSRLLKSAVGRVLEVAAGSGLNLAHYSGDRDVTAVDLSPGMLVRARSRGARKVAVMDAEHLAFKDGSFDTIVSTLGTCTFPDPVEALREMRRVCRPGGTVLLLEHGRSNRPGLAAWQDRRAPGWAAHLGCWWNRDPLENLHRAGLQPRTATREFLGMVHVIQASV
jgi:ubiquinone/menaquinone biosynthesis C-methylase UbiE